MSDDKRDVLDFPTQEPIEPTTASDDAVGPGYPMLGGLMKKVKRTITVSLPSYPGSSRTDAPVIQIEQTQASLDVDSRVTVTGTISDPNEYSAILDLVKHLV